MKNNLLITTALVSVAFAFTANVQPAGAKSFNAGKAPEEYTDKVYTGDTDGVFKTERKLNSAGAYGPNSYYSEQLTLNNVTFRNNTKKSSDYNGAAVYNEGILVVNGGLFEYNTAGNGDSNSGHGGAIFGKEGSETTVSGAEFSNNQSGQGGAIWTSRKSDKTPGAKLTVLEGTTFTKNKAKYGGGAIWSGGETHISGATFEGNEVYGDGYDASNFANDVNTGKSEGGGAIFVGSASNVTIDNSTFTGNNSNTVGGAIATRGNSNGQDSSLQISKSTFKGNTSKIAGGAISIGSKSEGTVAGHPLTITESDFMNNHSNKGGAIYSKGKLTIEGGRFSKNDSTEEGGAILNSGGTLTVTNATFDGNTAKQGGAIYGNGGTVSIKGGRFTNNEATGNYGGAIASSNQTTLNIEGVTFEGNHAKKDGGAISLTKEATFKGNNVFKNNYAGENKNDIALSKGTITLADGASLTLDGGISGKNGTLEMKGKSSLTVKDTTKVESKVENVLQYREESQASVRVIVTDKTMNNGNLQLTGTNGIFTNSDQQSVKLTSTSNGGAFSDPITYSRFIDEMFDKNADTNNLYTFEKDKKTPSKDVSYTVKERSAGDVANRLGVKEAEAATLLATSSSKTGSGRADFDEIQDTLRSESQYGNNSELLSRSADALVADAAPVVQTRETALSNMIFDAASDALDDNESAMVAQSETNPLFEKVKLWIKGLFNYADRDDTDKARGFDIDTYGVAMGVDKEIGAGKVGLGYAYSQSDINGYTRDTDVDTHSLFVYGQYQPADWYVKGVAAYSWSDYEEKKSVLGHDAKAKYDVDTLALQGLYGYNFHIGDGYNITPEGGLRYLHASQDSYTNGLGVRVKDRDIDVLTAVAGVKAAKDFAVSDSVTIRPEVRAALTYDLSTDDNNSHVVLANGQAIKVDGEELDRFGFELGAKVATDVTSQWEVAAGYEGKFREDYSDHTGILSAKYKF